MPKFTSSSLSPAPGMKTESWASLHAHPTSRPVPPSPSLS